MKKKKAVCIFLAFKSHLPPCNLHLFLLDGFTSVKRAVLFYHLYAVRKFRQQFQINKFSDKNASFLRTFTAQQFRMVTRANIISCVFYLAGFFHALSFLRSKQTGKYEKSNTSILYFNLTFSVKIVIVLFYLL